MNPDVIECQTCGDVLRWLSREEAAEVALRPYDFVKYCYQCRQDREEMTIDDN